MTIVALMSSGKLDLSRAQIFLADSSTDMNFPLRESYYKMSILSYSLPLLQFLVRWISHSGTLSGSWSGMRRYPGVRSTRELRVPARSYRATLSKQGANLGWTISRSSWAVGRCFARGFRFRLHAGETIRKQLLWWVKGWIKRWIKRHNRMIQCKNMRWSVILVVKSSVTLDGLGKNFEKLWRSSEERYSSPLALTD